MNFVFFRPKISVSAKSLFGPSLTKIESNCMLVNATNDLILKDNLSEMILVHSEKKNLLNASIFDPKSINLVKNESQSYLDVPLSFVQSAFLGILLFQFWVPLFLIESFFVVLLPKFQQILGHFMFHCSKDISYYLSRRRIYTHK